MTRQDSLGVGPVKATPRCFISDRPIPPGEGAHILVASYNEIAKRWIPVMTIYIHREVLHPWHLWAKHQRARLADLMGAFDLKAGVD